MADDPQARMREAAKSLYTKDGNVRGNSLAVLREGSANGDGLTGEIVNHLAIGLNDNNPVMMPEPDRSVLTGMIKAEVDRGKHLNTVAVDSLAGCLEQRHDALPSVLNPGKDYSVIKPTLAKVLENGDKMGHRGFMYLSKLAMKEGTFAPNSQYSNTIDLIDTAGAADPDSRLMAMKSLEAVHAFLDITPEDQRQGPYWTLNIRRVEQSLDRLRRPQVVDELKPNQILETRRPSSLTDTTRP